MDMTTLINDLNAKLFVEQLKLEEQGVTHLNLLNLYVKKKWET